MAGCATVPVSGPTGPPALAVWTLEDLSLPGTAPADLAEMLTARVMDTVEATGTYSLVERERLLAILQELNLGSSSLADEATGLRIGRLVGARLMVFGAYQVAASQMRLDLRLVEVESGRVRKASSRTVSAGNLSAWFQGAEAAARDLLSKE
ncbi:CsgG/HfaB family protein [uncultured Desulfosarcina sp.]|uniref:CsgG/HfaB family protein n=1 Tax=uncultured Desulfosarcina sp. TaxID=218289 RepID=UPI00374901C6